MWNTIYYEIATKRDREDNILIHKKIILQNTSLLNL